MEETLKEITKIYDEVRKEFSKRFKVIIDQRNKCRKCGHACFQLDFEERVLKSMNNSVLEILNQRIDKQMAKGWKKKI